MAAPVTTSLLMVEPELRYPRHGDQQANHRAEQSRSMLVLVDLNKQVGAIANRKIAGDHIGLATVNPASQMGVEERAEAKYPVFSRRCSYRAPGHLPVIYPRNPCQA
jgi:hypothetical protein